MGTQRDIIIYVKVSCHPGRDGSEEYSGLKVVTVPFDFGPSLYQSPSPERSPPVHSTSWLKLQLAQIELFTGYGYINGFLFQTFQKPPLSTRLFSYLMPFQGGANFVGQWPIPALLQQAAHSPAEPVNSPSCLMFSWILPASGHQGLHGFHGLFFIANFPSCF